MIRALAFPAAAFALGGAVPALAILFVTGLAHAVRSPDRLLDVAFTATFCGLGYLAG